MWMYNWTQKVEVLMCLLFLPLRYSHPPRIHWVYSDCYFQIFMLDNEGLFFVLCCITSLVKVIIQSVVLHLSKRPGNHHLHCVYQSNKRGSFQSYKNVHALLIKTAASLKGSIHPHEKKHFFFIHPSANIHFSWRAKPSWHFLTFSNI